MKTNFTAMAAGLATLWLAQGVFAQTNAYNNTSTNTSNRLIAASQLKDSDVVNLQNEELGDIDEVLIDPGSGRVRFIVIGIGGFLGLGETNVAIPWDAIRATNMGGETKYVLDATKERLEKAPRIEGRNYDRLFSRQDSEPTFTYWGITWYDLGPASSAGLGNTGTTGARAGSSPAATSMTPAPGSTVRPLTSPAMTPAMTPAMSPAMTPRMTPAATAPAMTPATTPAGTSMTPPAGSPAPGGSPQMHDAMGSPTPGRP